MSGPRNRATIVPSASMTSTTRGPSAPVATAVRPSGS